MNDICSCRSQESKKIIINAMEKEVLNPFTCTSRCHPLPPSLSPFLPLSLLLSPSLPHSLPPSLPPSFLPFLSPPLSILLSPPSSPPPPPPPPLPPPLQAELMLGSPMTYSLIQHIQDNAEEMLAETQTEDSSHQTVSCMTKNTPCCTWEDTGNLCQAEICGLTVHHSIPPFPPPSSPPPFLLPSLSSSSLSLSISLPLTHPPPPPLCSWKWRHVLVTEKQLWW